MIPVFQPHRRALIGGLVAAPAVLSFGRSAFGGQDIFPFGVASGDPSHDGFVIWTRLAKNPLAADGLGGMDAAVPVRWEIAADEGFGRIVMAGNAVAQSPHAHTLNIEISGLPSGRPYWYRFTALGQQSPVGRSLTTPATDQMADRLRIAVASCSHYERGYFSAYGHMADEAPDLTLFLGDYIYEYSLGADRADQVVRPYNLEEATTLAGYRNRYALHRLDADLQRLHAVAPALAVWDDHELQDDYSGIWSKISGTPVSDFAARKQAAYQAFFEAMPVRRSTISNRLYRQVRYGNLAQFFMLDGRQYRSRQPCSDGPNGGKGQIVTDATCTDRLDPSRTFLGFDQERWLYDNLGRSDARWNILGQNLVMGGLTLARSEADEARFWTDTWDGFPAARDRLTTALAEIKPSNPVVLGGDYHSFWTTDIKADARNPASPILATEFVGTSITSTGPSHDGLMAVMPNNPHIRFFDSRQRGYMALDITPDTINTRYQVIDDVRQRQTQLSTLKSWVVENGKAGAVAV